GSSSAGVLATTYYGAGTTAHLENNVINGNTTGVYVGYNAVDGASVSGRSNDLSGNDNGVALVGTGTANFSGNWWGYTDEAVIAAYMAGADQARIDFTPYLASGADTNGANGFQGDFSNLYVTLLGGQTETGGRINE